MNNLVKLLFIAFILLSGFRTYACGGINQRVYSGKIEYSLDPANPLHCYATITMDFDIAEFVLNDSILINWGDLTVETIHASSITEDTVASNNMALPIYTHVYKGSHIYAGLPTDGFYTISLPTGQYRINGINNIAGDVNIPFSIFAQVSIDTAPGMQYQPLAFAPLTIGFAGLDTYMQMGFQQTSEGSNDSIAYSFTTPLEAVSNPVPQYQLPDQFCLANGSSTDEFTIDAGTGNILWTSPCLQGVYCFGTLLSKYRNGQFLSSIMREQNIYVSATSGTGVNPVSGTNVLQLFPNPAHNTLTGNLPNSLSTSESRLNIIALDGRAVMRNTDVTQSRFETDISQLANGVYFVQLFSNDDVWIEKFVKQ